jgi:hypothetical protein
MGWTEDAAVSRGESLGMADLKKPGSHQINPAAVSAARITGC